MTKVKEGLGKLNVLIILVVSLNILVAGCSQLIKKEAPEFPPVKNESISKINPVDISIAHRVPPCNALGGEVCNLDYICLNGDFITAKENRCCSGKCIESDVNLLECSEEVIIIKETKEEEFLSPPNSRLNPNSDYWWLNPSTTLKKFYENYSDDYDFLVTFPMVDIGTHSSTPININVSGIGMDLSISPYRILKALTFIDLYPTYEVVKNAKSPSLDELIPFFLKKVIIHEIGHYWCCNVKGIDDKIQGHWINNLDLFNGDASYFDPMGYYYWIVKDGEEQCVGQNEEVRFSNLTLYLMGLIPSTDVDPIYVHNFEEKLDNTHYNLWGPACDEEHNFTKTRKVTINDIIAVNSEREPDYSESQKRFQIGFVVLVPYNQEIDYNFVNYISKYKMDFPRVWNEVTNWKSEMFFCK